MRKLLHLKAIQVLRGDQAAVDEILRALRKSDGNMRKACELLEIGKSSMYRLIDELGARDAVDELVESKGYRIRGKVLSRAEEDVDAPPTARKIAAPRGARLAVGKAPARKPTRVEKKLAAEPAPVASGPRERIRTA